VSFCVNILNGVANVLQAGVSGD